MSSSLEQRFRELLQQRRLLGLAKQNDQELKEVVQKISIQQGVSRQECLRMLLQAIVDEESQDLLP